VHYQALHHPAQLDGVLRQSPQRLRLAAGEIGHGARRGVEDGRIHQGCLIRHADIGHPFLNPRGAIPGNRSASQNVPRKCAETPLLH
jgi:hypothetical protein